jgi:branched-chain amino acid transport system ATP-binding protein
VVDTILETEGLTKEFRGFAAVSDVQCRSGAGSIHGLIGPNGAGKTTCFNLLTKFLPPTRGSIRYDGRDITGMKPAEVARLGLVRSFQISAVFPNLTVLENVRLALQRARGGRPSTSGAPKRCCAASTTAPWTLLEDVGLTATRHQARRTAYGRKRALEIATTLALEPGDDAAGRADGGHDA